MTRHSDLAVSTLFLDRWSPRAFDGAPMPLGDLEIMLEAARWAPSAYNYQPWRFLYALRGDQAWEAFLDLLIPFNRSWASGASALVFFVSERVMGDPAKPSHSHSFDAGAAWAQFALQASLLGYHAHGMTGLEIEAAERVLAVPGSFRIDAAAAVGRIGDAAQLSESLRAREAPSGRRDLAELAFAGRFPDVGEG